MFKNDIIDFNEIISTIESVSDTLYYSSFECFKLAIRALDFDLCRGNFGTGFQYNCTGVINGCYVNLNFYEFDDNIRLLHKVYSIGETEDVTKIHRDNDLPAIIEYNDDGQMTRLSYYSNNKEFRLDNKPLHISIDYENNSKNITTYYRYKPSFNFDAADLTLYHITLFNDELIDAAFCYKKELIVFNDIIAVLPEIKELDTDQLMTLKKFISKENLKLLEMALI
jgi:hypothetical protein